MTALNNTWDLSRPDITPYAFSRPFWEATREKRLLIQYCPVSGQYQFLPRPVSIFTGTRTLEWREVSGRGALFSYTIAWRGPDVFRGHEPYAVGMVTLDAGVNIIGNVVNCERADMRIGMRLEPYWHPLSDGKHLLMFQPEQTPA
jgi:uncharacterized OB-fold protein